MYMVGAKHEVRKMLKGMGRPLQKVKEVSILGGSFFEEGLSIMTAEWNIRNDPVAAKIVFNSGANMRVAGLDVSIKLKTSCKDFLATPRRAKVFEVVKRYATKFLERTDDMYFHDVLAAAVLFCEDICKYTVGSIEVDLTEERGKTIFTADPQGHTSVAYEVDALKFFEHYYQITEEAATT